MRILRKTIDSFNRASLDYMPSAVSIAIILTAIVFILALLLTESSLMDCVGFWGDGFWELLTFGMQMCVIIFTGGLIASSPAVNGLLKRAAAIPKTAAGAVVFISIFSLLTGLIHWGLSIVLSAAVVKQLAKRLRVVDYPLLTACAYMGVGCIFHAGLSASVPLLVATEGNFLQKNMGVAPIPVSETLLSPLNLILVSTVFASLTLFAFLLARSSSPAEVAIKETEDRYVAPAKKPKIEKPSDWMEKTPIINILFGAGGLAYIFHHFFVSGGGLDLNSLNFIFFALTFISYPSPEAILKSCEDAAKIVHGIIMQFPIYSGIYGIIKGSGLSKVFSDFFISIAGKTTYPLIVMWYSGILNYFIPSGGSKWVVEAPYIIAAGDALGVARQDVILAYAWGDMSTNIIQPFWAIPLLAYAGLEFKQIISYAALIFAVYFTIVSLGFFLYHRF